MRVFMAVVLALGWVLPASAASQAPDGGEAQYTLLAIALVESATHELELPVVVWGPRPDGADHLILFDRATATPIALARAAALLFAARTSESGIEVGSLLRVGHSERPGAPALAPAPPWATRAIRSVRAADVVLLEGFGEARVIWTLVPTPQARTGTP